jgi:hypothetical protein
MCIQISKEIIDEVEKNILHHLLYAGAFANCTYLFAKLTQKINFINHFMQCAKLPAQSKRYER